MKVKIVVKANFCMKKLTFIVSYVKDVNKSVP